MYIYSYVVKSVVCYMSGLSETNTYLLTQQFVFVV